jgi:phosphoribosylanthranilate isomerase
MPTEVKICGLSDPESVDAALAAGADLLGFVFFPRSPRHLSLDQALPLMRRAAGRAARVALLVDPDQGLLDDVVCTLDPDFLQLHGQESPERVAEIRASYGIPVIKAVGIGGRADLQRAARYAEVADRLLLDAKPPTDATRPGGNGAAFDWRLLEGFTSARPWLLSGGLHAAKAAATGAAAVDVSSGVERASGRKDPALIRAFVEAVHETQAAPARSLAG